ncbi:glycosyltransferase [Hanstruepera flava]|uniref:glycosyltransferase n=1 Tax=Hanstruepera flava TaxID=2930218 RepID=UPI002027DF29|nr:glycosyltransferase family 2 protein [Hanstruepera flava]
MTNPIPNIALVTPLKDEFNNIDKFLDSLASQSTPIKCLVIVENDSTDGSKEYLDKISSIKNVSQFKVININFEDKTYRVGKKYATIIDTGFQYLKKQDFYNSLDYIGILDCDVFPEKEYYYKITNFLKSNPKIGISSGLTYTEEGQLHIADPNFVRGNSRLWKKDCLDQAGYIIAYTADTVSIALAHLKGWKTVTLKSARVVSREVNVRIANSRNKGYHAYYRGHTLFYVFLKSMYLVMFKSRAKMGYEFFVGYLNAIINQKPRVENQEVRKYFRYYLFNKLTNRY